MSGVSRGVRIPSLDAAALRRGVRALARIDPDLAAIAAVRGTPPMWSRPAGFATLLHVILEQQVSLASAHAAFLRLRRAADPLTPAAFLALGDDDLRGIGFSRQKATYGRALAGALADGALDLTVVASLSDDEARSALMQVKGIGRWTADVYLLMALARPDVWPRGDLALAAAVRDAKRLGATPTYGELDAIAEHWRPWRSVAARLLWSEYLARKAARS